MIENEKRIIFDKLTPYLISNKIVDGFVDNILEVEKIKKESFYSLFPNQTKSLCLYFFNKKNKHIRNINTMATALFNALDTHTPRQLGEKGHAEYGWSNDIRELIVQLSFQVVDRKEGHPM